MPRKKETFLLVSLQEDKAKKLAQIVSNDTSRKILDYLSEKEATESELAKKLDIPISTIHYNLQALQKGGLVETEEFHYSEKGKEVLHYRLANKFIIIAPKSTFGLKEKLRNILPVALITAGVAFVIQFMQKYFPKETIQAAPTLAVEKAVESGIVEESIDLAVYDTVEESAASAVEWSSASGGILTSPVFWFIIGSILALGLYLLISYIRRKK